MRICFLFCLSFLFIISCSKQFSPEQTLENYINYRFSKNQTKNQTLSKVTGQLYELISKKSDDDFKKFNVATKEYKMRSLKISHTDCTLETSCNISYLVAYHMYKQGNKKYLVEVKKVAQLDLADKIWKIADVKNIKTYIDSKEQIEP